MINYDDNEQALSAISAVESGENLCLIGKAGVGKTTLVHHLKETILSGRTVATLAPTGIAAINAGGRTIHSLFHFPFRPLVPAKTFGKLAIQKMDDDTREKVNKIDVIIIDEISMVRADILDAIDQALRFLHAGQEDMPFGGVQLIMVGDPFQLPPVVANRKIEESDQYTEKQQLDRHYESPFFWHSSVFKHRPPRVIELNKVYRQKDDVFVDILNGIRNGVESQDNLAHLNKRVGKTDKDFIYVTSTRKISEQINETRMSILDTVSRTYKSKRMGPFPTTMIPPDSKQVYLKEGARVMMTYNDLAGGYVNGTIGTVFKLHADSVEVIVDDDYQIKGREHINVEFTKITHSNGKGQEMGSYMFMPIKPAWAITIHKSQGLTFSNVNICPKKIFASGQLYVALSRCRSLEGIILTDPVRQSYIKVDKRITKFIKDHEG